MTREDIIVQLAERIIRDLDHGLSFADMAQKHQVPIEEVSAIVDVIKLARGGTSDVERAAKAMVISSRILRDNGIAVIMSPEDLANIGKTVMTWSIIGAISLGFLGWGIAAEQKRRKRRI